MRPYTPSAPLDERSCPPIAPLAVYPSPPRRKQHGAQDKHIITTMQSTNIILNQQ